MHRIVTGLGPVGIALVLVLLGRAGVAGACTCKEPAFQQALKQADFVFVGAVTDLGLDYAKNERVTGFEVQRVFKGAVPANICIVSALSDGACGYAFARDTTYLVFAHKVAGRLRTHLCAGNRALAADQKPPSELGIGSAPSAR